MDWPDRKTRCPWANPNNPRYLQYHDKEWGVPVHDDQKLFEMLILENFQAGLSWECVLNKWEAFSRAFDGFNLEKVCSYGPEEQARLKSDPGIIATGGRSLPPSRMPGCSERFRGSGAASTAICGTGRRARWSVSRGRPAPRCPTGYPRI